MIDPAAEGTRLEPYEREWTSTDAILYALGVGAGADELAYTTENSHGVDQRVLPTFSAIVALPGRVLRRIGDVDWGRLVHARQRIEINRPLSVAGSVSVAERVVSIADKGPRRNAVVVTAATGTAPDGRRLLCTEMTVVLRGQGGFGGSRGVVAPRPEIPQTPPAYSVRQPTSPDQALLYRLSGDRNPLHSDPWFAVEKAGFAKPILHGLCTYGFAARAVVKALREGNADDVASIDATFSSSVHPGEVLATHVWPTADGAKFRVTASPDDRVVLDAGEVTFRS